MTAVNLSIKLKSLRDLHDINAKFFDFCILKTITLYLSLVLPCSSDKMAMFYLEKHPMRPKNIKQLRFFSRYFCCSAVMIRKAFLYITHLNHAFYDLLP